MHLNRALLLLKNSDFSISTITGRIGYHNSDHFAHLFKSTYDMEHTNIGIFIE